MALNTPTLVHSPHPLLAAAGRALINEPFLNNETIESYLIRLNIDINRPLMLQVNGQILPRDQWPKTTVTEGMQLTLRAIMHDGGNGDNNKALRSVLTIAVMIAAQNYGGVVGAALGGSKILGTALISVGGMLAVNALLPPPSGQLRSLQQGDAPVSPTYSLSGGTNRARRFEPLPLIIGAHRLFPDIDAQQYTEFQGDDQYLFMSLNFGLSNITLSDYRIGNTPLASFSDFNQTIDLLESGPDGALNWFPGNVDTLAVGVQVDGQPSLIQDGDFDNRPYNWWIGDGWFFPLIFKNKIETGGRVYDVPGSLVQEINLDSAGDYWLSFKIDHTAIVQTPPIVVNYSLDGISGQVTGVGHYTVLISGVTAGNKTFEFGLAFTSAGDASFRLGNILLALDNTTTWTARTSSPDAVLLAVDLVGYLFFAGNGGLEQHAASFELQYRAVGSSPWIDFVVGGRVTIINSNREPVRRTYNLDVASGQYEVRVRRITPADPTSRFTSNITWSQLRSFQTDDSDYIGQQRVAIRIRASGSMSGRIDAFNAIATGNYEAWNGSAWVLQATSNPAWLYRWFANGKFDSDGRRLYGAGKPDAEIDIAAIQAWGAWCDLKGLQCNLVLDRRMTTHEVLATIARCGRASTSWGSGLLGVVWDADSQPSIMPFGMSNIIKDTFRIEYITQQLADEIVVEFINPALDWLPDTVRATVPGVANPVNPLNMQLWGITNEEQAGKEANLIAAAQQFRRRRVTWESDLEGMVVQRGDVITLSHDLTQWGYSGRAINITATEITLDRDVPFTPAEDHYIGLREVNGDYNIYSVNYQLGESNLLTFVTPLNTVPAAPFQDVIWCFEPATTPGKLLKILDITPINENRVRITATDEDPLYYAAEDDGYGYVTPGNYSLYYPTISNPEASDTLTRVGKGYAVTLTLKWEVTGNYGGSWVRWRMPDEAWQLLNFTTGHAISFSVPPEGIIEIEITALNDKGRRGETSAAALLYTIVGNDDPISNVRNFIVGQNGAVAIMDWDEVPNIDVAGYEIRRQPLNVTDWDSATLVKRVAPGSGISEAGIPPGSWTLLIKAYDDNPEPIYSIDAATANIEMVNALDVIDTQQSAPEWFGVLTGFIKHHTGVLVVQDQNPTSSYEWEAFDQYVPSPVNQATYESLPVDIGLLNTVRTWAKSQLRAGPGETGNISIRIQLDFDDGSGYTGTWTDWTIGERTARYFKYRLLWEFAPGVAIPVIELFEQTVDLSERTERWDDLTVPIGGLVVTFATPFHRKPFIDAQDHTDSEIELVATEFSGPPYAQFTLLALDKSTRNDVGGTASVVKATGV